MTFANFWNQKKTHVDFYIQCALVAHSLQGDLLLFFFNFICIKHSLHEKANQQALCALIQSFAVIFLVGLMFGFFFFSYLQSPIISVT